MPRVRELDFTHPVALFRGDGSGVGIAVRADDVSAARAFARIERPFGRVQAEYVVIVQRSSAQLDTGFWAEVELYAVDPEAAAVLPGADAGLTALGQFDEVLDPAEAARLDRAGAERLARDARRLEASEIRLHARIEGRPWSVRAHTGPDPLTLECRSAEGELRIIRVSDAVDLARAEREWIEVVGRESVRRRGLLGRRLVTREVRVELGPVSAERL